MARNALTRFRASVKGESQSAVARKLGCSRSFISLVLKGERRPGHLLTQRIQALYGIAHTDWLDFS